MMNSTNVIIPIPACITGTISVLRRPAAVMALCGVFLLAPYSPAHALAAETDTAGLDTIVVIDRPFRARGKLDIKYHEDIAGRADDLNNLLIQQPGVSRLAESGSQLSVKSDGYYDNRSIVRGVPLLHLSHFPGQLSADRSIVPLAVPADIDFLTRGFAGVYSGVSGSILNVNPIVPTGRLMPRPEVRINYGTIGADLTLGLPFHKAHQYYMLTYRPSDAYTMYLDNRIFGSEPKIGYSRPASYTDVQFLGSQRAGKTTIEELLWLSKEVYSGEIDPAPFETPEPPDPFYWGIAAVSLRSSYTHRPWRISAGGCRQYYFEGKRIESYIPTTSIEYRNVAFSGNPTAINLRSSEITTRFHGEYIEWQGELTQKKEVWDFRNNVPQDSILRNVRENGTNGMVGLHLGWNRRDGNVTWGLNGHTGLFLAGPRGFFDPGIWMRLDMLKSSFEIDGGVITSQPDIRGLPSADYAEKTFQTVRTDIRIRYDPVDWVNLELGGYAKYKDHIPVRSEDPALPLWDETENATFHAEGVTGGIDINWRGRMRLWSILSLSQSTIRKSAGKSETPEWDIPWTNNTVLTCAIVKEHIFFHVIGEFAAGALYRNIIREDDALVWGEEENRGPAYKRIDAKIELRQEIGPGEKNMVQYDVYILAWNIVNGILALAGKDSNNWINVREYYWNNWLEPTPITLKPFDLHIGTRIHIRF